MRKREGNITLVVAFIAFLFLSSCTHSIGRKGYDEINSIPKTDIEAVKSKFLQYSIEEQIDIYLYSKCCVEGNKYGLARFLIIEAESKIPYIVEKLNSTENIIDKTNLIRALKDINLACGCIANDKNIIKILEENYRKIQTHKDTSLQSFEHLYNKHLEAIKNKKTRNNS